MAETHTAMKTFDCPWCGAITPVPIEHMGEHFKCPECKKATKLTVANTSDGPPTQAPAGAPHLVGDRTFDCPWCGAIAAVPSSHLGDRFHCPECDKETKLTATNTRATVITAPPPDAPHVEPSRGGRGVLVGLIVVAAAVGAWFAFGRGGGDGSDATRDTPPKTEAADTGTSNPKTGTPSPTSSIPATPPASTAAADASMASGATPPSNPPAPAKPEDDAELLRAQGELATATQAKAAAIAVHDRAAAAIAAWKKEHAGAEEAATVAATTAEVRASVDKIATDRTVVPDPASPTPDQARAARAAIVGYLLASPERTAVAQNVHAWLSADLGGREGLAAAEWKTLDWRGDGTRRALAALSSAAAAVAATVPQELVDAEAAAAKAVLDATATADKAQARVNLLTAPRDDRPPAPSYSDR